MTGDIKEFIAAKRKAKVSDNVILEELMVAGWSRSAALNALTGSEVPAPPAGARAAEAETVMTITPTQVVKGVRSKLGIYARAASITFWISAFLLSSFLVALRQSGSGSEAVKTSLISTISGLIILLPIFFYSRRKQNQILSSSSDASDDVFYKKSLRWNIGFALIFSAFGAIGLINSLLTRGLNAQGAELVDAGKIVDSTIYLATFLAGLVYFWTLNRKSRKHG